MIYFWATAFMYHKQLVTHVTSKLAEGVGREVIERELILDGWSKDDIEEAFYYNAYPEKMRKFSLLRILHSEVPAVRVVVMVFIFAVLGSLAFIFFRNTTLNYTIHLPAVPTAEQVAFTYGEQPALSDPDFFGEVKEKFISEGTDFIEADLSAMTLRVHKDGEQVLEVPIDSKGREGSWWETPAGLYKISSKEKAHFSSLGHVWMPWSMNFQGNFFIHGRTYYPDGTLTSKEFTGGCIRLSTEDAEKVYGLIDTGTPVLVFEHSFSTDDFSYEDEAGPRITAPSYLSADLGNNRVFASKDATKVVPIASITKLMTALVATEYISLDASATVPQEALVHTSKPRLKAGSQYRVYELLFPLLMESSNESAETIARHYGREKFIRHMNEKATAIGMTRTHFEDPSGVSSENTASAEDLFMLAKYIYNNRSFIFNITSGTIRSSAYGESGFTDLQNFNNFTGNEFFFGGKNGKTSGAQETNLSVFEFPVGDTTRPVVSIVLGSIYADTDAQSLLEYTLNHFR
jgi:hypothetical protein